MSATPAERSRKHYYSHVESERVRCREKNRAKYAASYNTVEMRAHFLFHHAKRRAAIKGLPFSITKADVVALLLPCVCAQSGLPLSLDRTDKYSRHPRAPSLDRIAGERGYVVGNIQIVCSQYNYAKSEYGAETLLELAQAIVANNGKRYGTVH